MKINYKKLPRTGHSRLENQNTQSLRVEKHFNNPDVLVEGWYPLLPAKNLKIKEARSFLILKQRVVVWRGEDGSLRAHDAFCPHLGADLGNGQVIENKIRCAFHHWTFSESGDLLQAGCAKRTATAIKLKKYPVEEYLGYVWVYAGESVQTPFIVPPGLEKEELHSLKLAEPTLFAHHHVMMTGGVDLQHFSSVHGMNIDFDYEFDKLGQHVFDWKVSGKIAPSSLRGRLGRLLIGSHVTYQMRVGGGSMVSITYGENQKIFGRFQLPKLHLLWGCMPLTTGVSKVFVFSVVKKQKGLWGKIKMFASHVLTLALIVFLKDDDTKAFPNMRFQATNPTAEDRPLLQLIHAINSMPESLWTKKKEIPFKNSTFNIGL